MEKFKSVLKKGMERLGSIALCGVAAAALMVTTVNVRSCCWFVLGQDRLPNGAEKLRRFREMVQ